MRDEDYPRDSTGGAQRCPNDVDYLLPRVPLDVVSVGIRRQVCQGKQRDYDEVHRGEEAQELPAGVVAALNHADHECRCDDEGDDAPEVHIVNRNGLVPHGVVGRIGRCETELLDADGQPYSEDGDADEGRYEAEG